MTALLLKDFYTLLKQARLFLLIIVVFALFPGGAVSTMAVVYATMLPMTALAYDERAKWDTLAAMLPYTPRALVMSKYLVGYVGVFGAAVLSVAAQGVLTAVRHTAFAPVSVFTVLLTACFAAILLTLSLPVMFRFGVEKGRVVFLIVFGAVGALVIAMGDRLDAALAAAAHSPVAVTLAALAAAAVLNAASICVSTALYRKRAL